LVLSQKRADNTLKYFTSQGIAASRITAIGFGETLPLTRCSNGEDCAEVEFEADRRAEIKVQQRERVKR
jgi:outer membrane protein OmpA-like peptidoglycan-associated protein